MLVNLNPSMLAPADYPPLSKIFASVALTFFAYLGFGVISFVGGDIENPKKNMPRAMYISLGFTMVLYIALSIGVFGTLTVEEVIDNADTALAVAAYPIFGDSGVTLITLAAVFATTGAINSQLYASIGATYSMAKDGQLPPIFSLKRRRRAGGTQGLVISSLLIILLSVFFDVTAIASIGSAVSLTIFRFSHRRPPTYGKRNRGFKIRPGNRLDCYSCGHPTVLLEHPADRSADLRHPDSNDHPGMGSRGSVEVVQQTRSSSGAVLNPSLTGRE